MNILFFEWGAYTYKDTKEAFIKMGIGVKTVSYCFEDKNNDDFFIYRFTKELKGCSYDAVFSINYFPLVAECCHRENVKYISWSYDNPLNVYDIEATLLYPTNYVFLFDRVQASEFIKRGFDNVFHLPLAVNCERLDRIVPKAEDFARFGSSVSFVGKLYDSQFPLIFSCLDEYGKGYIESLISAQKELYGCFLLSEAVTDDFTSKISQRMKDKADTSVSKEALIYALSSEVTRRERLLLLGLLGKHLDVKLYSREINDILKDVKYMGSAGYLYEMPLVFKTSKINLNNTLKCIQSGIPLRVLDICGCKGFLLTNYQEELLEYFEPDRDIVLYESIGEAYEKALFYEKNDDARNRVALNGYGKAKELFDYKDRVRYMLEVSKTDYENT